MRAKCWEVDGDRPSTRRLVFGRRRAVPGDPNWCDELVIRRPVNEPQMQHVRMGAEAFDALAELVTPRPYPDPRAALPAGSCHVELEESLNVMVVGPRRLAAGNHRIHVTDIDALIQALVGIRTLRDIAEEDARAAHAPPVSD